MASWPLALSRICIPWPWQAETPIAAGADLQEEEEIRNLEESQSHLFSPAQGVQAASGANVDEGSQLDIWRQLWILRQIGFIVDVCIPILTTFSTMS